MSDLVEWLTKVLDGDEEIVCTAATEHAIEHDHYGWAHIDWNGPEAEALGQLFSPAAVLADIAAKRARIALHQVEWRQRPDHEIGDSDDPWCAACLDEAWPCPTLRLEVSAYADRPGYDESWRP